MRVFSVVLLISLLFPALSWGAPTRKPADLPDRFRDFKIYTTSAPDAAIPAQVAMTVQMHNEGSRPLKVMVRLLPSQQAGFAGGRIAATLKPRSVTNWKLTLHPPANLRREVLRGQIFFGKTLGRDLFIAVQGPDPADFKAPDVVRITARAEAVATYAPRATVAWWRSHPSAALHPDLRRKPLLTLAEAGRTRYSIAVGPLSKPDGATEDFEAWSKRTDLRPGEPQFILAVRDLARCIATMSGAALPITVASASPAIRLSVNTKRKWNHTDAFHLHTTRQGDVLIEAGHVDGLRQGIYRLLNHHLGCHWFLPGQLGEEIPAPPDRRVVLGQINEQQAPSFFSSTGMSWSAHGDWDRRNKAWINRGRMNFGHAWSSYLPPTEELYKAHPDWWARDREGKIRRFDQPGAWSSTNFCSTSPEVIELVAKKVNEALRNPDVLVASLDPNDYAPMCLCDRCLAVDASYGVANQDGTYVTDRLLHFSKEIYNRLEPANRDKWLGILIYAYQIELPKTARPHPRHTGIVCNMEWTYDHTRPFNDPTSPRNREFYRIVKGWGKLLSHMGFYDYYAHWSTFAPWGLVHKIREDLPAFKDLGGSYLEIEAQPNFAMYGLNNYIASRLAWNVNEDVDVLMEEFFSGLYGPAAPPMRAYWKAIEWHNALNRSGPRGVQRVAAVPGLWQELDGYLKTAEKTAATAPQRFRDRVKFHREAFDLGRLQWELTSRSGQFDAALDHATTLARLQRFSTWVDELKKKYPSADGYWPTFIASYLYPEVEAKITEVQAAVKAQQAGLAPPPAPPAPGFVPQ